jgi:anti-sigma regulatory factor (Ser/Thr protein kinase)
MRTLRHVVPHVRQRYRQAAGTETSTTLAATPVAPRMGRAFTAEVLANWGLGAVTEDARLVVSELITNAVRESALSERHTVLVRLRRKRGSILIEVGDHGIRSFPRLPPQPADQGACDGRGLPIVACLSAAAGTARRAEWRIVWARLAAPCPTAAGPPHAGLGGRFGSGGQSVAIAPAYRPESGLTWASRLFRVVLDGRTEVRTSRAVTGRATPLSEGSSQEASSQRGSRVNYPTSRRPPNSSVGATPPRSAA